MGEAPSVAAASWRRGSTPRRTGSTVRTTNGTATSAWPTGTSHHAPRQSTGGVSNVIRIPNPIVTADVAMGSISPVSSRRPARRAAVMARAASSPMPSATAVATTVVRSEIPIAATGSTPMLMPGRTSARPSVRQARREWPVLAAQRTLDERDERGHHDERRAGGDGRHEPSLRARGEGGAGGRAAAAPAPGCDGAAATSTRRRPARRRGAAARRGWRRSRGCRAAWPGARSRPRSSSCRRRRAPGSRRTT